MLPVVVLIRDTAGQVATCKTKAHYSLNVAKYYSGSLPIGREVLCTEEFFVFWMVAFSNKAGEVL